MVSEDLVIRFARAIARAEGFFAETPEGKKNLPQRCNNPGDLTDDGDVGNGTARSHGFGAADITIYSTVEAGWNALFHKVRRALNGSSAVYTLDMSISQFGLKYAKDAEWGINVAKDLGVPPYQTLADLAIADLKEQRQWGANG